MLAFYRPELPDNLPPGAEDGKIFYGYELSYNKPSCAQYSYESLIAFTGCNQNDECPKAAIECGNDSPAIVADAENGTEFGIRVRTLEELQEASEDEENAIQDVVTVTEQSKAKSADESQRTPVVSPPDSGIQLHDAADFQDEDVQPPPMRFGVVTTEEHSSSNVNAPSAAIPANNAQKYKCETCEKMFNNVSSFNFHVKKFHPSGTDTNKQTKSTSEPVVPAPIPRNIVLKFQRDPTGVLRSKSVDKRPRDDIDEDSKSDTSHVSNCTTIAPPRKVSKPAPPTSDVNLSKTNQVPAVAEDEPNNSKPVPKSKKIAKASHETDQTVTEPATKVPNARREVSRTRTVSSSSESEGKATSEPEPDEKSASEFEPDEKSAEESENDEENPSESDIDDKPVSEKSDQVSDSLSLVSSSASLLQTPRRRRNLRSRKSAEAAKKALVSQKRRYPTRSRAAKNKKKSLTPSSESEKSDSNTESSDDEDEEEDSNDEEQMSDKSTTPLESSSSDIPPPTLTRYGNSGDDEKSRTPKKKASVKQAKTKIVPAPVVYSDSTDSEDLFTPIIVKKKKKVKAKNGESSTAGTSEKSGGNKNEGSQGAFLIVEGSSKSIDKVVPEKHACNFCAETFEKKGVLIDHLSRSHRDKKITYDCAQCKRKFTTVQDVSEFNNHDCIKKMREESKTKN